MVDGFGIGTLLLVGTLFVAARLLSVRSVFSLKAALAEDIARYGSLPTAIVEAAWTGSDYKGLDEQLDSWNVQIRALAISHESSPLLHDHPRGLPIAIAVLDDALSILMRCTPVAQRPDGIRLRRLRGAINDMLTTLKGVGLSATREVPARPVFPDRIIEHLDRVGFESEGEFMIRRSLLLAWVQYSGQAWYDDQPTFLIGKSNTTKLA